MFKGRIALLLRTLVLYPASGLAAGALSFVSFDEATNQLVIDVNGMSIMLAAAIWSIGSGGTFAWSRLIKNAGGDT